jgi:hypothetical protein
MSCYVTFGGYRNRKRIARDAVEWFLQHRKLNRFNTFIHIVDKRLWPQDDGACIAIDSMSRPRYFEIEIENRLDNKEQYLTTLFHELIHVEQRLRNTHSVTYDARLCRSVNKWHGDVVPPETAYMDEPWEVEAYGLEGQLYKEYREYEAKLKN